MRKNRPLDLGILAGCLIIFGLCTVLAVSREMQPWEGRLLRDVYNLPRGLYVPFYILTISGSVWTVGTVAIVLVIRKNLRLAKQVCLNALLAAGVVEIVKNIVMRPRPYLLLSDIPLRAFYVRGYGFPSGHSAVAAAVATTLWPYLPRRYRPLLILWVVLVGLSRIYLGVHAPLDVLGGATLGCGLAIGVKSVLHYVATKRQLTKPTAGLPN